MKVAREDFGLAVIGIRMHRSQIGLCTERKALGTHGAGVKTGQPCLYSKGVGEGAGMRRQVSGDPRPQALAPAITPEAGHGFAPGPLKS